MDQLWEIALKANTKSVSTEAIHILNNYYINYGGGTLDKEEEFVERCMNSLIQAMDTLKDVSIMKICVTNRDQTTIHNLGESKTVGAYPFGLIFFFVKF